MSWPTTCVEVEWHEDGAGFKEPSYEGKVGDLLWNPKMGEGHILVAEIRCGEPIGRGKYPSLGANCGCYGYLNPCNSMCLVCECGEDPAARDHHYFLLARKPGFGDQNDVLGPP